MRWQTNEPPPPEDGDERSTIRFAWKPVPLDDGTTVWLEHYGILERYFLHAGSIPPWMTEGVWLVVRRAAVVYYA